MRNIKTMLQKSSNTALLFAAASGLLYMTACSSDVDYKGAQEVSESNVTVGNDPAAMASRVTFFGGGTRAEGDEPFFPEVGKTEPKLPEGLTTCTSFSDWNGKRSPATYEIPTTNWSSNQITVGGWDGTLNQNVAGEVYITGKVSGVNLLKGKGTVYVIGEGALDLSDQELQIESGVTLKYYKDITIGKDLKIQGANPWVTPAVPAGQLLTPYNVYVKGDLNIEGELVSLQDITVDGKIQYNNAAGLVKGRCIEVNAEGDHAVDMSGNGRMAVVSYLSCNGLYVNGGSMYFYLNAMADVAGDTKFVDPNNVQYYTSTGNSEKEIAHALIRTNKVIFEGGGDNPELIGQIFGGNLKLKYEEYETKNPANAGKFPASAEDYYISKQGCNPGNGAPTNKPFKPIAVIEGPTHQHHHLSATCVQDVNGRAYVSYHLNEAYADNAEEWVPTSQHMGCVEVYNVTEEKAEITNWLMNQNFDFNHLIVSDNKVYTTGDTRNFGATLGVIELDANGGFGQYEMTSEGRAEVMKEYNLYKKVEAGDKASGSGNCIIRDGNIFRIASYNGFQSFNVSDLTEVDGTFIETTGSAKHIAQGGGYIVTLNLDEKGVDESTGTVTVYTTWGNKTAEFKTNKVITPINGKNVIATDGQHIYVALGQKGVDKYDMSGTLVGNYDYIGEKLAITPAYKGKPLANGLCIDDKYVYVANGAAGLIVLNKSDMKRVSRYAHATKFEEEAADAEARYFSANYVQKVGDLIYIAYGRNGLEIVKMNEE